MTLSPTNVYRLPIYAMLGHGCVKTNANRLVTLKKDQYVVFFKRIGTGGTVTNMQSFANKFRKNSNFRTNLRRYLAGGRNLVKNNHKYLKTPYGILEIYRPGEKMDNHILEMFEHANAKNVNNYSMGVMKVDPVLNRVTSVIKRSNRKNSNVSNIIGDKKGIFIYMGCRYNRYVTKMNTNENKVGTKFRYGKRIIGEYPNNLGFLSPAKYAKLEGKNVSYSIRPSMTRSYLKLVKEHTGFKRGGRRTTAYVKGRRISRGPGGVYAPLVKLFQGPN